MAPIDSPWHSDVWLKGKHSPRPLHGRNMTVMDPCKILEPKRKTLQSLQAERIMTVLQDTVKRMEIITALPCILDSLPRFSVVFGQELTAHLRGHLRLQNAYKDVLDELYRISEQDKALELGTGTSKLNPTDNEGFVELPRIEISTPGMLQSKNVLKQEEEFLRKGIKCNSLTSCTEFQSRIKDKALELGTGTSKMNPIDNEGFVELPRIEISTPGMLQSKNVLKQEEEFLRKGIKCSLKQTLRFFQKNPKAIETITGGKMLLSKRQTLLMDTLTSLECIMKEKLLMTPLEEQEKKVYLTGVINREMKTNATREKLEMNYSAAVKEKESEIAERDSMINRLENELQLKQKFIYDQQRRTLTEAYRQTSNESKASKAKVTRYYEDIFQCKKKILDDRKQNRENETQLRKRRYKMATEVYNWVQKYDADLDGRQDEYDLYTRMYEADKKDLAKLQAHFEVLEKQYDAIMEERRLAEEEKARKEEEERKQNKAAAAIQAVWRRYQFKNILRGKSKKSTKKDKNKK